jgi:microsomal dipeptidase-like Zn-dependent dipeptidase
VLALFDYIGQHNLVLETGHISAKEVLMVVPEARRHGVQHIVITDAMSGPINMTIPQMQEAAKDGALIKFVYAATLGPDARLTVAQYAAAIKAIGPQYCILGTDLGGSPRPFKRPMPPQGLLGFMTALHKEGISVADINMMTKTNPALMLGLKP